MNAPQDVSQPIERLGFAADQIVQEFGFDSDTDEDLRLAIESCTGGAVEDEDYTGEVDVVLLWWRGDDGDLTDALVDLVALVDDQGFILLLTPRPGTGATVEVTDIEEAAKTAGLHPSGMTTAAPDWRGVRLVPTKGAVRR